MSKLTLLHINIIGVVVALMVGAGLYFTIITGAMKTKADAQAALDEVQGRADKLPTATRALEKAQKDKAVAEAEWSVFERQYMPVIGYTDNTLTTWMKVFLPNKGRSWPERFIRTVRGHMERERKANGIVWENPGAIVLPAYGPDPNTIQVGAANEGFGPVLHYAYQMSVRARSIEKLMQHIRSWSSLSQAGVPVVDGLQVAGNSPNLSATYNVTFTIIVRDKTPAPVTRISGSGGGTGGMGGGMGGPMGGMGMMPGMAGGPGMMPGMAGGPGRGGPQAGSSMGMSAPPGMMGGSSSGGGMTTGGGGSAMMAAE
ncbi:MAG: hypothetical protein FJX72_08005 [Armatimonadetes bacterium]|nr:hypothetical protein [Armatimonadota bacterium]